MEYTVKARSKSNVKASETAVIATENWKGYSYHPYCTAQLEYVKDKGFQVLLTCYESAPLQRYKNFMDPVWTDSCLEFFANFAPQNTDCYLNFEMNSAGAWLVGFGPRRDGRVVPECFQNYQKPPKATVEADRWSVKLFLELDVLKELFGDFTPEDGYRFRGNFFKCGDETPAEHYLSWNPIEIEEPDFHRPDFFGDFVIRF